MLVLEDVLHIPGAICNGFTQGDTFLDDGPQALSIVIGEEDLESILRPQRKGIIGHCYSAWYHFK